MMIRLGKMGALLLLLFLSSCSGNTILVFELNALPVFYVVENPVNPTRAKLLANALGIEGDIIASDGSIRYLNRTRFQAIPMIPLGVGEPDEKGNIPRLEGFDFESLRQVTTLSDAEALQKAEDALELAGLRVQGGEARLGRSRFEAVNRDGSVLVDLALDTHVDFEAVTPNGYPFKGPGADIKIVFDGEGVVTQLHYAFRILVEGERRTVLSIDQASVRAAAEYFNVPEHEISLQANCAISSSQLGTLCLESEVVYYAPPIGMNITQVVPHYLFKGNVTIDGATVPIRNLLVPALDNAPKVTLTMSASSGNTIKASASSTGGQAPYQYSWASSTTPLAAGNSSSLSYAVLGRQPVTQETLSVTVTDANGVSSWTSQTVTVNAPAPQLTLQEAPQGPSVGAVWIGLSQGLPYAASNTQGLLTEVKKAGVEIAFNWGEAAAHQKDFAKATDHLGIDSVDLGFYTGHAYGLGFFFESLEDRRSLTSDQASWGETNLEWLIIAACGPLQEVEAGISWWRQWGNAFNGLHLMLAYANITYDNNREGRIFGEELFGKALPLRQAWASTATETQTPTEIYAVMGVWGADKVNNYNDHFWGYGAVGPDIPASEVEGYWRLTGPS